MSRELGAGARSKDLAALLLNKNKDGAYAVDDKAARATVVLLALGVARGDPTVELSPFLTTQLGNFCAEAGVAATAPPAQLLSKLEAFLLGLIPATLRQQLEAFYREEMARGGNATAEVASMLGLQKSGGPLESGVRPKGTTAAGPMARFALVDKVPKKK